MVEDEEEEEEEVKRTEIARGGRVGGGGTAVSAVVYAVSTEPRCLHAPARGPCCCRGQPLRLSAPVLCSVRFCPCSGLCLLSAPRGVWHYVSG